MSWNYNSPLSSVCLFYRQRIHFKRQFFNNQVVFIDQRITVPSTIDQSHCTEIAYHDPQQLIAPDWRHQEQIFRKFCVLIGWEVGPRGYWLFSSNRKEIWSPTRLHFPYLVTRSAAIYSNKHIKQCLLSIQINIRSIGNWTEQLDYQWEDSKSKQRSVGVTKLPDLHSWVFYTDQVNFTMALASLPVSVIQEARTVIDGNSECDLATTVHNFVRPSMPSAQFTTMAKLDEVQQVGWIVWIFTLACRVSEFL